MNAARSFAFTEAVTSDLAFTAQGESVEELFAACAEALLAATVEDLASVEPRLERHVRLEEPDLELLLLAFLNELVFLRDAHEQLLRPAQLRIERADGAARLDARLVGEPLDRARHRLAAEVKAATAHGLRVARAGAGWEANVTLDV